MTAATFARILRRRINANTGVISDADLVDLINLSKIEIVEYLIKSNPALLGVSFTIDLENNIREYKIPTDIYLFFFVSAVLSGIKVPLKQITYGLEWNGSMEESYIQENFNNTKGSAAFAQFGNFIRIFSNSVSAVTNGLRLDVQGTPKDLTVEDLANTTRDLAEYLGSPGYEPGIPKLLQPHWITLTSRKYKLDTDSNATLDQDELEIYTKLELTCQTIKPKTAFVQGSPTKRKGYRYDGY